MTEDQTGQGKPSAPAGWYPDASGRPWWWDGREWTAAAVVPVRPDRTWATISHLTFFVFPIISSTVILLTFGRDDRFVKHHAAEALNAQIWLAILWNALLAPAFIRIIMNPDDDGFGWWFAATPVAFLCLVVTAGFAIRGTVQAYRGRWWRYPLPFRFVLGSSKP